MDRTAAPRYRPQHKKIRLNQVEYGRREAICSVTVAVRERRPVFENGRAATDAVQVLRQLAERTGVLVYGYCIMPDHVHLVVSPSGTCDVVTFVGRFKNLVQRAAWKQGIVGAFWQASFWDHFVRADEQIERVVDYVLANPVRRGLVSRWQEYPFSGSLVFAL